MSWRNKLLCLMLVPLLAACGFQPLYARKANGGTAGALMAGVKVDDIPGRPGQQFRANLEDRLNPDGGIPEKAAYRLKVSFSDSVTPIGVSRDGTVSRYNVYLTSKYTLYRIADDKEVTSGDISYVDSYNNITSAFFSTYISEEDAITRGITELSELYRQRLSVFLSQTHPS